MPHSNKLDMLKKNFPIESQTSNEDKLFILDIMQCLKVNSSSYNYIEVGSFMGGTLAPFLIENHCHAIFSVDDRERAQPDERGVNYDYAGITSEKMINNLHHYGLNTEKLILHDGSIETLQINSNENMFDLAFIDGEHTDEAAFRDFLYIMDFMKKNCIIMFHDSTLVFKALKLIILMLDKQSKRNDLNNQLKASQSPQIPFKFFKRSGSEMSCLLFGLFTQTTIIASLGISEELEEFFQRSEKFILDQKMKNLVKFNFSYTITDPKTVKAY